MIRGEVEIDIRQDDGAARDRHRLIALDDLPDGVRVRVLLGSRSWLFDDSLQLLHDHGDRLDVTLTGVSRDAVERLVHAARSGEAFV